MGALSLILLTAREHLDYITKYCLYPQLFGRLGNIIKQVYTALKIDVETLKHPSNDSF